MVRITRGAPETERLGARMGSAVLAGALISLTGEMGAGKTAFVRGLARGLGVLGPVTSPTFQIVNEYEGRLPLFHFDLYRLEGSDALFELGWEDYLSRGGVCAVEWSERVRGAVCFDVTVGFRYGAQSEERVIEIEDFGGVLRPGWLGEGEAI